MSDLKLSARLLDTVEATSGSMVPLSVTVPDKGTANGTCWRTHCNVVPARWYNRAIHKYYCAACAVNVNNDPLNALHTTKLGGTLCVETHPGDKP